MPNWCNNNLTLTFPTKEEANELFQHMKKEADDDDWSFFGFFVPEVWDQDSWYWSRVEAWGTKWDANIIDMNWVDDLNVVMTFDTAWGPPIGVYDAAHEQGIYVEATYYEPGMCFVGAYNSDEGNKHIDYAHCESPTELRECIGDDLDDEYGVSEWMEEYLEEERLYAEEQEKSE